MDENISESIVQIDEILINDEDVECGFFIQNNEKLIIACCEPNTVSYFLKTVF